MKTRIKICGICRVEDAKLSAELGAWAIGINFVPSSPRQITIEAAQEIIRAVAGQVLVVGVFADQKPEEIAAVSDQIDLDLIQLHGHGDYRRVELLRRGLGLPIIQGFGSEQAHFDSPADFVLIDGPSPGSGEAWDWSLVTRTEVRAPIILAGGINTENILEALRAVQPFAIDIASGSEEGVPGIKSPSALRQLFSLAA